MANKRKNFDPDEIGGSPYGNGPGSITDPTGTGGASKEGGSPKPDPKKQKTTDGGRIRYSGNNPNVGGERENRSGTKDDKR